MIAIAVGMGDGLGAGDNTRAALITRGLSEITRLGVALGGLGARHVATDAEVDPWVRRGRRVGE